MIIRVEQLIDGKNLFLDVFEDEAHLKEIFNSTIPDPKNSSTRLPTVLWNLMETTVNNIAESNESLLDHMMDHASGVIKNYAEYLSDRLDKVNSPDLDQQRVGVTTFGGEGKVLGKQPVKIAGVVLAFLKTNHAKLDVALYETKILQVFLKLMIKYHWNNIFHNYVTNIVSQVLEGKYPMAKTSLYEDDFIQELMLESVETQIHPKNPTSTKGYGLGYLGHIKKIAQDLMKASEDVQDAVLESSKWKDFRVKYLDEELERERKDLGGVRVRQDQNPTEETFDFSIEEIRSRFSNFLNPEENSQKDNNDSIAEDPETFFANPDEAQFPKETPYVDDPNYTTQSWWVKSMDGDHDIDNLLSELT